LGFFRDKEPVFTWGLTRSIIESRKYHHLPFTSGKTRKASGVIYSEFKGMESGVKEAGFASLCPRLSRPENQELQCLKAGKDRYPGSRGQKECALPLCLFVLFLSPMY
jgi:hypothetical protein